MSKIINEPKTEVSQDILNLRSAYEFRARWLYFLVDSMRKAGVENWHEIARDAMKSCGVHAGKGRFASMKDKGSIEELYDYIAVGWNAKVMELSKVINDKGELEITFGYCPLVHAWQQLGASDEDIDMLCRLAMDGDEAQSTLLDNVQFHLDWTIAQGGNTNCRARFSKK